VLPTACEDGTLPADTEFDLYHRMRQTSPHDIHAWPGRPGAFEAMAMAALEILGALSPSSSAMRALSVVAAINTSHRMGVTEPTASTANTERTVRLPNGVDR
jgi:hypothetical protein